MVEEYKTTKFTSLGFWLPCFQSSFFTHAERDSKGDRHFLPLTGPAFDFRRDPYPFDETNTVADKTKHLRLETSIYRRLLMVLPKKHYTAAVPLYRKTRQGHARDQADPVAVLYVSDAVRAMPEFDGLPVSALTLLVQQDGYYVWTAAFDAGRVEASKVHEALRAHVAQLVGGDFSSHESGRPGSDESASATDNTLGTDGDAASDVATNLTRYRDDHIGMLTFFQINTILEGLYNANLDFRVFFTSDSRVAGEFTLGRFIEQIVATFSPRPRVTIRGEMRYDDTEDDDGSDASPSDNTVSFAEAFSRIVRDPAALSEDERRGYEEAISTPNTRSHMLDTFLTVTEVICLKPMKDRIERCRRSLLDDLIEVTHRREPLVQAEPPDEIEDRIEDVTEAQLRGYVMLFAAKMPLVNNVRLHLEDIHYSKTKKEERQEDVESRSSRLYAPFQSWKTLLEGLQDDVQGLIDAINQSQADRMLYEQEQIHAEQETLAEIQRLRERTDAALSPARSLAINIVANLLAFIAVILGGTALVDQNIFTVNVTFGEFLALFQPDHWPEEVELIKILALLVIAFVVLDTLIHYVIRTLMRLLQQQARLDAQYYYEFDVHVDAPFHMEVLPTLFEFGVPKYVKDKSLRPSRLSPRATLEVLAFPLRWMERAFRRWWDPGDYRGVRRNSYRTERLERAEALHKVYVEAQIRVSRRTLSRGRLSIPIGPGRFVPTILVYELMYHRPAQEHGYIFKDIHAVSTHSQVLSREEVIAFKRTLVRDFINPCLQGGWTLTLSGQSLDAFFTVTEPPDDALGTKRTRGA